MKKLKPFSDPPPPPPVITMCKSCNAFRAECLAPVGDEAVHMCWLCAHAVVEHGCDVSQAYNHECECCPADIYPHRAAPPMAIAKPEPKEERSVREIERDKLLKASPDQLKAWVVEAHKQMSVSQHAAVKKRLN